MSARSTLPSAITRPSPPAITDRGPAENALVVSWQYPARVSSWLDSAHSFGRDDSCDSVLPGAEVSRQHARVVFQGRVPKLQDAGSRNGTHIDGQRIQEVVLCPGQVVRIGEWVGLVQELDRTAAAAPLQEIVPGFYGGALLQRCLEPLRQVARGDLPVVIEGETGTGKEGAARAVHVFSGRPGPLVAVDCGAVTAQLADALFFGHKKGAFTGATHDSTGYLRAAHGGTLFLDEVLNLDLATQAKLLRALELREVVPVGEVRPVTVDVLVVCAAQEPLANAVRAGQFRQDLAARLSGYSLRLPPLRERREDIVALFLELLRKPDPAAVSCEPRLIEALLLHDWPCNVRELAMLVRRLVAVHGHGPFRRSMLPTEMCVAAVTTQPTAASGLAARPTRKSAADQADLLALLDELPRHDGNLTAAARALGMSRSRANRVLKAHPELLHVQPGKDVTS